MTLELTALSTPSTSYAGYITSTCFHLYSVASTPPPLRGKKLQRDSFNTPFTSLPPTVLGPAESSGGLPHPLHARFAHPMQNLLVMVRLLRTSTIPNSINTFCKGLLKELENEGYDVSVASSPGKYLDEIAEREGVEVYPVAMERHMAPLKDLKSLWGLIKVMHKVKPDIVHSITPKAGLLTMMAAWICRVPVRIHTFTGLVFPTATGLTQKILIFTDRLTCACATHVVPEGEGVKNDLINYKITKKPLTVLGHGNIKGIDLERFNPENPEVMAEAEKLRKPSLFTFVFVGRLVGDKGINELIKAFSRLEEEYGNCRLVLVGPEEAQLDPLMEWTRMEIETNPMIDAVGRKSDVRPWYAMADAFVFPSYREGFPNCVIEAGAMGLPSIVTDINGSREIIRDGENGLIIPSKNEDALYVAMERMLTDAETRNRMAKAARSLVASRYEQSYVRDCLKRYYREVAGMIKN